MDEYGFKIPRKPFEKKEYHDNKGRKHRVCGPAVVHSNTGNEFWFHGFRIYSGEQFMSLLEEIGTEEDKEEAMFAMIADDRFLRRMDYREPDWWDYCIDDLGVELPDDRDYADDTFYDLEELLLKKSNHRCVTSVNINNFGYAI